MNTVIEPRGTLLTPWRPSRRDEAIANLQRGFNSLNELMSTIRESIDTQNKRQQELVEHLSALPKVLEMIPDSTRMHGETLKAINEQIANQSDQQRKLGDILEKVSDTTGAQKETLDELKDRVDTLNQHDQRLADNLQGVGAAMDSVSKNSHSSAQVLENLRDNINSRDGELERILHRQGTRFTTMLAIAIFLAVAALTAVAVLGYMVLQQQRH